ncbi:2-methoxy-6-polyprenyl-1,4-benzoquinol methylase, mitochondrial [Streptomyces sp. enrichment culture]|uniref:class I SAM-dependent methyltransferase n=1 Tax=Streptomyces TaxID=1883 RepID=UPI00167379E7|nr:MULTISPECIES: methyltransferase domain-containing protein [Streptomyces]MBD3580303.1 methyltransferase domain-containing protein [Streptomyces sp. KD18]
MTEDRTHAPEPAARPAPAPAPDTPHTHTHVQEFFGARAAAWDAKFPDDGPAFAAAVAGFGLRPGDRVLDAGCGTGRALPALRAAVGPNGSVLGADLTPQMLDAARQAGRDAQGVLLLADAARLPLRDAALDAVFASGLVAHLPEPAAGLRELARVVRAGGRLALFHPIGRAALAARQGRELTPDDLRAEHNLRPLLAASGWELVSYEDLDSSFLAVAVRRP